MVVLCQAQVVMKITVRQVQNLLRECATELLVEPALKCFFECEFYIAFSLWNSFRSSNARTNHRNYALSQKIAVVDDVRYEIPDLFREVVPMYDECLSERFIQHAIVHRS